jgi:dTDP-4-dehydrorhamnose 3,5-epimerase
MASEGLFKTMFETRETAIPGCLELQPVLRADERGQFVKTFHSDFFLEHGLETEFREQYYSISRKGVLRGFHFQRPPDGHNKMVYCTSGEILDVVVDLRVGSETYGDHITLEISSDIGNILYVPEGLAHGFYAVSDATIVYNVSSVYSPDNDDGILWDSAGVQWPVSLPVVSRRDMTFTRLADFESPFHVA